MPLITQSAHALEMIARYSSIRRAAELVNGAPWAVNRQILNLWEEPVRIALRSYLPRYVMAQA